MIPEISGLELCRRLRNRNHPLPVLMLTAKDSMALKLCSVCLKLVVFVWNLLTLLMLID